MKIFLPIWVASTIFIIFNTLSSKENFTNDIVWIAIGSGIAAFISLILTLIAEGVFKVVRKRTVVTTKDKQISKSYTTAIVLGVSFFILGGLFFPILNWLKIININDYGWSGMAFLLLIPLSAIIAMLLGLIIGLVICRYQK